MPLAEIIESGTTVRKTVDLVGHEGMPVMNRGTLTFEGVYSASVAGTVVRIPE